MIKPILPKELSERIAKGESFQIVDVRSPAEFESCHIPGARNVPLPTIIDHIPDVDAAMPLVLVCQGGMRSASACTRIEGRYPLVYDLIGGTNAWCGQGLEAQQSPKGS